MGAVAVESDVHLAMGACSRCTHRAFAPTHLRSGAECDGTEGRLLPELNRSAVRSIPNVFQYKGDSLRPHPADFPPNRGGDYLVYSEAKQENIDPPIVFYCPSGALQP